MQQKPKPQASLDNTRPAVLIRRNGPPGAAPDETATRANPVRPLMPHAPSPERDHLSRYQPIRMERWNRPKRRMPGCLPYLIVMALALAVVYFLLPLRTNILILGTDRPLEGTNASRTDTMILMTVVPLKPYVGMLSIPRDLWLNIPDVGENRINTAFYFAELNQPGSGPKAAAQVVETNFAVPVNFTLRIHFDGVVQVVDALGGVTVDFPAPAINLPAGTQTLNGTQALAYARDRKGTDDFFRMQHGQLVIRAIVARMFTPAGLARMPLVMAAVLRSVNTDLPAWLWPRIALAVLRAGPVGTDGRTLTREMVTPFTTSGGAMVLLPQWELIRPAINEMFRGNN